MKDKFFLSNLFSQPVLAGQAIFWVFVTVLGEIFRLAKSYFQQFKYTFTATVLVIASQLDFSSALGHNGLLTYGELFTLFYSEIILFSLIFFGFFYFFYAYNDKEQGVLKYMQFLIYSFVLYAVLVYTIFAVNGGATQPISLHFLFFKGAVWVDLSGYFLRASLAILSALFVGILYINTNNARIFILELPFLLGLLFFIFLVSACAHNFVFLFILMEIITLIIVVTVALYFVAIGPRLVRAAIKFFILNLFITTLYLLGAVLLLYNMPENEHYTLSYLGLLAQWFNYNNMYMGWSCEDYVMVFRVVMVFILLPLFFKLTLAPFSIWVVNVYAHLPQFFLLILLTFYKIIYSLIFIKVVLTTMDLIPHLQDVWSNSLFIFVFPSLFVGCLAFRTQDLGQVLAYTTVSNLGYILSGFLVATELSIQYALIYLVVYSIQLIALFVIFIILHKKHKFSNLNQLFLVKQYSKVYYYSLVFIFFSLAGVPPLAGFFTKYFLFLQVYTSGMYALAIAGLVSGFIMSIVYLQIALQLVLVKRNNYQSFYYELTKSGSVAYNYDFMLPRIIFFFTMVVVGSQVMNVLFFFMLPAFAKTLAGVYSFVFLLV